MKNMTSTLMDNVGEMAGQQQNVETLKLQDRMNLLGKFIVQAVRNFILINLQVLFASGSHFRSVDWLQNLCIKVTVIQLYSNRE